MSIQSPLIVAMDFANAEEAIALAKQLKPSQCRLKVGKELFTRAGPQLIKALTALGFDIFLDLKFHDIPTTVAKAVKAAAELGVWMVNVHASGGASMMKAARDACEAFGEQGPLLIAVTVLTSMSSQDLHSIGIDGSAEEHVLRLAKMAQGAGLDGVVCSAHEAKPLKNAMGNDFKLVTPGIRPAGTSTDDQQRIMTPKQALNAGSDYLVIGRPITKALNPVQVCEQILHEISTNP